MDSLKLTTASLHIYTTRIWRANPLIQEYVILDHILAIMLRSFGLPAL